ncbi:MAG TPA: hypothetical protein VMI32_15985 [Candidatus Solibacter sp.]|nr:hypothetical protein [Candidatus Solibacter sp.]
MSDKKGTTFVEEFRERLERENLERLWKLEALDHLYSESQDHPALFERLWIKPLTAEGLTLDSALNLIVESHFRPN